MSDINNGLQLHLKLNEIVKNAAGKQEVIDLSSGKVNGKVLGNPAVVADSRFGKSLKFNGNDDGIIINPMNNFPSNAITVLCWIKSNNKQKAGTVLSYAKSAKYSFNEFQVHDIRNLTPTVNNKWYETKVAYNDGEWHSVAVTWQSSDGILKVYKDGKEEHSRIISAGNPIATGGALVVGQEQDLLAGGFSASQAFEGQMAHLRIYNRVLSPEEINSCMKADETAPPDINNGLQLHLQLNEIVKNAAAEQQVTDLSSGKVNGKVLGNPAVVADSRFGSCISFDGVDDYVELPPTTIPTGNEITISFWANGGSSLPKQNSIILAEDKDNNRVVNIHLPWSDGQIFFDCGNQGNTYDRIEKLALKSDFQEKWTHWVFTKNATTGEMKIYLNGILWQSGTGKNKPLTPITKIRFGTGYYAYHGKVANLRIYNRVLSPEEINSCMKADETGVSDAPPIDSSDDVSEDIQTTEQKPIVDIPTTIDSSDDVDADSETVDETDADDDAEEADDDDSETVDETDADEEDSESADETDAEAEEEDDDEDDDDDNESADETDAEADDDDDSDTVDETDAEADDDDSQTVDQKPMEYQIYQVNGNPTIQTGYKASEWTAIIAGFNCGAKNKKSGTGLTIMPIVDNGEWKIKCDIKDADDKYWDVAVLFIRNNMVNRLNNFHR